MEFPFITSLNQKNDYINCFIILTAFDIFSVDEAVSMMTIPFSSKANKRTGFSVVDLKTGNYDVTDKKGSIQAINVVGARKCI